MNAYGRVPMIVDTWPGPMKPSIAVSGESRIARNAGATSTWLQKTVKLRRSSSRARRSVRAIAGAVVSKPTPKNTTSRSGLSRAIDSASSGEYTMRTSAPRAFASSSDRRLPPGTRSMSPKLVKITSGRSAIVIASSMRPIGMTQTGQPGPWTSSTSSGRSVSSPWR